MIGALTETLFELLKSAGTRSKHLFAQLIMNLVGLFACGFCLMSVFAQATVSPAPVPNQPSTTVASASPTPAVPPPANPGPANSPPAQSPPPAQGQTASPPPAQNQATNPLPASNSPPAGNANAGTLPPSGGQKPEEVLMTCSLPHTFTPDEIKMMNQVLSIVILLMQYQLFVNNDKSQEQATYNSLLPLWRESIKMFQAMGNTK